MHLFLGSASGSNKGNANRSLAAPSGSPVKHVATTEKGRVQECSQSPVAMLCVGRECRYPEKVVACCSRDVKVGDPPYMNFLPGSPYATAAVPLIDQLSAILHVSTDALCVAALVRSLHFLTAPDALCVPTPALHNPLLLLAAVLFSSCMCTIYLLMLPRHPPDPSPTMPLLLAPSTRPRAIHPVFRYGACETRVLEPSCLRPHTLCAVCS